MEKDFDTMVNEIYEILDTNTNDTSLVLPKIDIERTPTRLHWTNVKKLLQTIKRNPDHFMSFLKLENPGKTIDWYSDSKSDGLIIHGMKLKLSDLTELTLKYVNNYVLCPSCHHKETKMIRDTEIKKYKFECLKCGFQNYIN